MACFTLVAGDNVTGGLGVSWLTASSIKLRSTRSCATG